MARIRKPALAEVEELRRAYVLATPRQRLKKVRECLDDQALKPNDVVVSLAGVEAFARCLVLHQRAKRTARSVREIYPAIRDAGAPALVAEFFRCRANAEPEAAVGERAWALLQEAVEYRNLLIHECTWLNLPKAATLVWACRLVLYRMAEAVRLQETLKDFQWGPKACAAVPR
jgi:hypothetical protein